jgi:hypothetical protein
MDFFKLHIISLFPFTAKPYGYFIYISSSRSPCRNVVFTSICSTSKSNEELIDNKNIVEFNLATGEKISPKSIPSTWE